MKLFKKRLNKKKLAAKSLTEETAALVVAPMVHQHNDNKPLPPSPPRPTSMPAQQQQQQATTVVTMTTKNSVEQATKTSNSWLELNLVQNDFFDSFDIPSPAILSSNNNKTLEINNTTEKSLATTMDQESSEENITETTFSYPDNHIDTTDTPAAVSEPLCCSTLVDTALVRVDGEDSTQDESPLQSVEKQGEEEQEGAAGDLLLNDTFRDANVLADNATSSTSGELRERDQQLPPGTTIQHAIVREEQVVDKEAAAAVTSTCTTTSTAASALSLAAEQQDKVIGQERDNREMAIANSSKLTEEQEAALQQAELPVDMCTTTIDNQDLLEDCFIAESPPLLTTSSVPSEMAPMVIETKRVPQTESPLYDLHRQQGSSNKPRSSISLIPRSSSSGKQQPPITADVVKKDGRRASSGSSSFIPVLATRHQHQNVMPTTTSKDISMAVPPVCRWSPSSSSERNSVSSTASSSSSSSSRHNQHTHQDKKPSLHTMKSNVPQQQQQQQQLAALLQSKIPKAMSLTSSSSSTDISNKMSSGSSTAVPQHVSRLPTKRNSTLA